MSTITRFGTQSPPMDDSKLASEARTDARAFAELYRRHLTRVFRYHMARLGNTKDAEDLTSQTFMAALEAIRSFRNDGTFAAWILGIAMRKQAQFFRGHNHTELPLSTAEELPDPSLPTDKAALRRVQLQQVQCALQQISPDRAQAIALCFFGSLSSIEAGRVLGKSEAAVKMLVSRGLHDLRTRTSLALEAQDE
jgi:RNA polymerase sigma-70 factor (ECF subfamily)